MCVSAVWVLVTITHTRCSVEQPFNKHRTEEKPKKLRTIRLGFPNVKDIYEFKETLREKVKKRRSLHGMAHHDS